jgi:hypothetical protein
VVVTRTALCATVPAVRDVAPRFRLSATWLGIPVLCAGPEVHAVTIAVCSVHAHGMQYVRERELIPLREAIPLAEPCAQQALRRRRAEAH